MNSNLNKSTQQYKQMTDDTTKMSSTFSQPQSSTSQQQQSQQQQQQQQSQSQAQQPRTPESESSNFECYQNYTAPEVFLQHIAGIVNQGDVEIIVRAQKQMLQRFEKTNEMLLNCNALSNGRLKSANEDFKKHIRLISDMKKDLDYIFKKIRNIKSRIGAQYPQAMKKVEQKFKNSLSEEARGEGDGSSACGIGENLSNPNDPSQHTSSSCSSSNSTATVKRSKDAKHHSEQRKLSSDCVTVNYVQIENGVCVNSDEKPDANAMVQIADGKAVENDSTDNESSDTSDT